MNNEELSLTTPNTEEKGSFIRVFFVTFLIALLIRVFIAQPFIVNGASMEPTFESGEYLIVDELTYRFREPVRGEVIVFKYPQNPSKYFIKRVVGLPGEIVEIKNNEIFITNGEGLTQKISEEYLIDTTDGNTKLILGGEDYFVLGDNRLVSSDSRTWGAVSRDLIIGRAFVRFLPITRMTLLPGDFSQVK